MNEATTRKKLIDVQLSRAGWTADSRTLLEEFPLRRRVREAADSRASHEISSEFADCQVVRRCNKEISLPPRRMKRCISRLVHTRSFGWLSDA